MTPETNQPPRTGTREHKKSSNSQITEPTHRRPPRAPQPIPVSNNALPTQPPNSPTTIARKPNANNPTLPTTEAATTKPQLRSPPETHLEFSRHKGLNTRKPNRATRPRREPQI
ncbi:hypothetical protein KC19_1G178800 [Ceratodon purpureus]|uniref:Uncharacterized protein n=1 Tax=Ceratodon purpureus TaxID=3225 RepID=A0A8T0J6D6_CERPU|nr:hypothetical protein KC19_1G178800 [Ceratodon purpureus]